jgi:membrane-associated protein
MSSISQLIFNMVDAGVKNYPVGIYGILFLIIFVETGLVIFPFLPGDSLLFTVGALAATGSLNPFSLFLVLIIAALVGDNVNYGIGHYLGPRVFNKEQSRLFKRSHLEKTQAFYEKHGGKTVIMARFVPIVRTFAPFVAGIGSMRYRQFIGYSVTGAVLWVGICLGAGYFFGNIPIVKQRFELVIIAIVLISVLPMLIEFYMHRKKSA